MRSSCRKLKIKLAKPATRYWNLYLRKLIRYIFNAERKRDRRRERGKERDRERQRKRNVQSTCIGGGYGISVTKQYFTRLARTIAGLFRRLQRHWAQIGFVKEIVKVREPVNTQPRSCTVCPKPRGTLLKFGNVSIMLANIQYVLIAKCFDRSPPAKLKAIQGQSRVSLLRLPTGIIRGPPIRKQFKAC